MRRRLSFPIVGSRSGAVAISPGPCATFISAASGAVTSRSIGTGIVRQPFSHVKRLPAQADGYNAAPEARQRCPSRGRLDFPAALR